MDARSPIFAKRRVSKREQAQDLIMCLSKRALVSPSFSASCTETTPCHSLQSRLMDHSRCCTASWSPGPAHCPSAEVSRGVCLLFLMPGAATPYLGEEPPQQGGCKAAPPPVLLLFSHHSQNCLGAARKCISMSNDSARELTIS